MNPLYFTLIIYAFVVFRICNRAFQAYRAGSKTWPILAVLAAAYIIFGAMWRFTRIDPQVFWIGSIICVFASAALYRGSVKRGY